MRKFLFSKGLRYRVNNCKLSCSLDIVLKKYNTDLWRQKINLNIARDYANNVDFRLAGWKVIRVWECEIRTKAKREAFLENLYQEIIGTEHESNAYESTAEVSPIAAEPRSSYGYKKI